MRYEYIDRDGDALRISFGTPLDTFCVTAESEGEAATIYVEFADAPTVAAEILKAAGQESVIVPKTIADVQEFANGQFTCGWVTLTEEKTQTWMREVAASYIAIAEHIEGKASREAEAEKKLQERRDALAKLFSHGVNFSQQHHATRRAINHIIALEDATK